MAYRMRGMKHVGLLLVISHLAVAQPGGPPKLSPAEIEEKKEAEELNTDFSRNYFVALAAFSCILIAFRLTNMAIQHLRTLACLSNDTQRYFAVPSPLWSKFKARFLYAPLFRTRHNREFRLSSAINMGTLPTRFQSIFIGAFVATNVFLCVHEVDFGKPRAQVLSTLRNRTGTISVANLIPMVIMAGRNNPLITWLNVPFDSFNMMHRWLGRLAVLEAIAHMLCWTISKVETAGWSAVKESIGHSPLILTGLISGVAFVAILIQSPSAIRHAFYETFLHLHIALVILAFVGVSMHLSGYPQRNLLFVAIAAWIFDRSLRFWNIIYRNIGCGGTNATIEVLPGDALRVTYKIARPWNVQPGQHIYVTIPSIGLWTSHPFSVAWSESSAPFVRALDLNEKPRTLVTTRQDLHSTRSIVISTIVRRRTGFTNTLYTRAEKNASMADNPQSKLTLTAFVEGPYGPSSSSSCNTSPLSSYGTVILFATGVGISHQVPYLRALIMGHTSNTIATRRITLVWIVQSPDHLEWIRPWMTQILALPNRRKVLRVKLFVTRPKCASEVVSPSASVQMFPGRPDVDLLIGGEWGVGGDGQLGMCGVTVCGAGGLADEVRRAVRRRLERGEGGVDFLEESFTW